MAPKATHARGTVQPGNLTVSGNDHTSGRTRGRTIVRLLRRLVLLLGAAFVLIGTIGGASVWRNGAEGIVGRFLEWSYPLLQEPYLRFGNAARSHSGPVGYLHTVLEESKGRAFAKVHYGQCWILLRDRAIDDPDPAIRTAIGDSPPGLSSTREDAQHWHHGIECRMIHVSPVDLSARGEYAWEQFEDNRLHCAVGDDEFELTILVRWLEDSSGELGSAAGHNRKMISLLQERGIPQNCPDPIGDTSRIVLSRE